MNIKIKDVINHYDEISNVIPTLNTSEVTELVDSLKGINIVDLDGVQIENMINFIIGIKDTHERIVISYLLKIIDEEYKYNVDSDLNKVVEKVMSDSRFYGLYRTIMTRMEDGEDFEDFED